MALGDLRQVGENGISQGKRQLRSRVSCTAAIGTIGCVLLFSGELLVSRFGAVGSVLAAFCSRFFLPLRSCPNRSLPSGR